MSRAWVYLVVAGLLEFIWAVGLKQSHGLSRPGWTALTIVAALLSMYLLSLAMRELPVGTAYAVWTGIGAVGAALIGMVFLKESRDLWRVVSLVLIVAGIVGLKLSGGVDAPAAPAGDAVVMTVD